MRNLRSCLTARETEDVNCVRLFFLSVSLTFICIVFASFKVRQAILDTLGPQDSLGRLQGSAGIDSSSRAGCAQAIGC